MCKHDWKLSYKSYKDNKLVSITYFCLACKEFKEEEGDGSETDGKRLDETDKRLNQTVRQGKAHGKNINNLRSKMKNGQWHYEYIK